LTRVRVGPTGLGIIAIPKHCETQISGKLSLRF
jgi:hypothetical protein